MPEWRPAGQVSEFASLFAPGAPSPRPSAGPLPPQAARPAAQTPRFAAGPADRMAPQMMAPQRMDVASAGAAPTDCLNPQFGVWGLFWRMLVASLGSMLIIPAPWTTTMFYRYIVETTWLPSGRRFTFAGKGGDIWYVFIGIPLSFLLILIPFVGIFAVLFAIAYLNYLLLRWFCDKVGTEDGTLKVEFNGGFWGFFGWLVLFMLSLLTIIGWAWVMKFFLQWICRNVSGTINFDFVGTGWGILWRYFVVGLVSQFLIPIPWILRWFTAYLVRHVRAADDLATHFD